MGTALTLNFPLRQPTIRLVRPVGQEQSTVACWCQDSNYNYGLVPELSLGPFVCKLVRIIIIQQLIVVVVVDIIIVIVVFISIAVLSPFYDIYIIYSYYCNEK